MIGWPSMRDFLHFVDNNLIPNCPITRQDILAGEYSWARPWFSERQDSATETTPSEGAHVQYTSNHHGTIPTGDLGRRCHVRQQDSLLYLHCT